MRFKKYFTKNPSQTKKLGEALAKEILSPHHVFGGGQKRALIIGLMGDLGGGKTTFLQGFARVLGIEEKILSPTFIIMRKFEIRKPRFGNFYHFDCYRIEKPKEILDLGFKKIISNPKNIVAVEWADRVSKALPKDTLWLEFEFINKNSRRITLSVKE